MMSPEAKIKFLKALKRKMRFNVNLCVVGKFHFYGLTYKNVLDIMEEQKISTIEEATAIMKESKEWKDSDFGWWNNSYRETLAQKGCVRMRIWMANAEYRRDVIETVTQLKREVLFEKTKLYPTKEGKFSTIQ